jgi:hypothetical protein
VPADEVLLRCGIVSSEHLPDTKEVEQEEQIAAEKAESGVWERKHH